MVIQHEHQHDETMLATIQLMSDEFVAPRGDDRRGQPRRPSTTPRPSRSRAARTPSGTNDDAVGLRQRAARAPRRCRAVRDRPLSGEQSPLRRVRRRRRLRRPAPLDGRRVGVAPGGRPGRAAVLAGRGRRILEPAPVRPPRGPAPRRARAARVLVRGRRLRPLVRRPPADRDRVGGRGLGRLRRPPPTSVSSGGPRRRSGAAPPARAGSAASSSRRRVGMDEPPTSSGTRGSGRSRTASTPRCSSGPSTRCCAAASWATDPVAMRTTFRNWDYPIRRQIFAGFRCARDA